MENKQKEQPQPINLDNVLYLQPAKQPNKKKSKKRKQKTETEYTLDSEGRNVFITIYPEQLLPKGNRAIYEDAVKRNNAHPDEKLAKYIEQMKDYAYSILKDKVEHADGKYFITVIYHDKDVVNVDGRLDHFKPKKEHFHISLWNRKDVPFRLQTILNLLGIKFDPERDYTFFNNGAISFFPKRRRPNTLAYLLHITEKAMIDGKHEYDFSELFSNQPAEAVKKELDKYHGVTKHSKLTDAEWDTARDEAYDLGYNLGDFDSWGDRNFTTHQQASSPYRILKQNYIKGYKTRIAKDGSMMRSSIVIFGDHNLGKSYATSHALSQKMHEDVYFATRGSGKYDDLTINKTAMVFDDIGVSEALSVFDHAMKTLHRRGSNDTPWAGKYAVVTTNKKPWRWIGKTMLLPYKNKDAYEPDMHYKDDDNEQLYQALLSRLTFCHIERHRLVVDSLETRGSEKSWAEHDKLFLKFANAFNSVLAGYNSYAEPKNAGIYPNHDEALKMAKMIEKRLGKQWLSTELADILKQEG